MQDEGNKDRFDPLVVIDAECGKDDFIDKEDGISESRLSEADEFGCTEAEAIYEDTGVPNSDVFSRLRVVDTSILGACN
jgi:hypothetical protein